MSEVIYQWLSRVTKSRVQVIGKSYHEWLKKSLFKVANVLFHFLHVIIFPEHSIPLKQSSIVHFAIVAKEDILWSSIVTSPQLISDVTRTRGTYIVTHIR